jgi:AcrR family transcriptional regulator
VEQSQRGRLLFAIVQVVAEKGYVATTVADVVERASVSRSTFYEQFPDKESCFLAAFNLGVEFALGQMAEAQEALPDPDDWRARVRSDLSIFLKVLVTEPGFARALHLEVLAAGPAALQRRAEILALFTQRTRRIHELARRQDRSLPELPPEVFELHTGGMDELVRDRIRTQGVDAVPDLLEPAVRATLALFGDRQ